MTTEEKAKAYDEAIKRAKSKIKNDKDHVLYENDIIEMFPELEDERIRKALKEYFINSFQDNGVAAICGVHIKDILAWLEKLGEPNPYSGVSFEYNGHTWGMCARDNGVDILCDKHTIGHLEKQCEQKNAWGEEDEVGLGDAMWAIEQARTIAKDENDMGNLWCAERWLKSLKERIFPQPKQEWSEEDRKKIIELVGIFESAVDGYTANFPYRLLKDYIRILKSCIPQSTWKPSDEQMKALNYYIKYNVDSDGVFGSQLVKLYQDLLKLREE